jgi:Ca2+-binding RTX toxin-like protein
MRYAGTALAVLALITIVAGANAAPAKTSTPALLYGSKSAVVLFGSVAGENVSIAPLNRRRFQITDSAGIFGRVGMSDGTCKLKSTTTAACNRKTDLVSISGDNGDDRITVSLDFHKTHRLVLNGGNGADRLVDQSGASFIYGGDGPDRLRGGRGQDYLQGDGARDSFHAGRGHDRVFAGNAGTHGEPDKVIDCGRGNDRYSANEQDPKPRRCERAGARSVPVGGFGPASASISRSDSRLLLRR